VFHVEVGDILGDREMSAWGIRKPRKALTARFVEAVSEPGLYFDGNAERMGLTSNLLLWMPLSFARNF